MDLNSIPELISDIQAGRMVILVDDEDRENEGDLVLAADQVNPQSINFMASEARGLICLSLTSEQVDRLALPLMVKDDFNRSPNRTAFTVSIEAATGVSTGISAADRARTIKVASNPLARPEDVIVPGHIFPIRAQMGGVLKRAGHTEASVDLVRLAGLNPAAVICEIMNPDGTMARLPELREFARRHAIKIGTIESLIQFRLQSETVVNEVARAPFPTALGQGFTVHVFQSRLDGREHLAFVKGDLQNGGPALVRVHSEQVLGDVFRGLPPSSYDDLAGAIQRIDQEGRGVLLYLRTEDDLGHLCERISTQERGEARTDALRHRFRADERDYGLGAQILRALGLRQIRLLTNQATRRVGIRGYELEIVETLPLWEETGSLQPNQSSGRTDRVLEV